RRRNGTGREQVDAAERLVVAVAQPGGEQAEARLDAAERRRDERLATAVDDVDDASVAGDRRLDRGERAGKRRRLPTPGRADRRARQRSQRQPGRGLLADRPGGRPIGQREALLVRSDGWLTDDEPDPAPQAAGSVPASTDRRLRPDRAGRRRPTDRDDRRGAPFVEGLEVVAQPCL